MSPPITLLEALRCGVPAIVSECGALAGLGEDGETMLQVPPNDERALTEKMRWILDHPGQARQMRLSQQATWTRRTGALDLAQFYRCLHHGQARVL